MELPFSTAQFFAVMADYNVAVWPAQLLLTLIALAIVAMALRWPGRAGPVAAFGLAFLWTWLAFAYHLAFFWRINPAAPLFAAVSLAGAAAFAWQGGVRGGLRFEGGVSRAALPGLLMVALALVGYPAIGAGIGHRYPAAPTFGLPCPVTLFTVGLLLLASPRPPRALVVAPLVWAVIGSTAAFALGVTQDLGLVLAAVLCLFLLRRPPA